LADLREAAKSDSKRVIETKLRALSEASASMAQRIYASQQQGGGADQGGATGGGSKDDNVVDAEFEEVKDDKKSA
jgi:molecular chaperone DnaK